jgi:hypothetical protein
MISGVLELSQGKVRKVFFFEKKETKNFCFIGYEADTTRVPKYIKVFWFFFHYCPVKK